MWQLFKNYFWHLPKAILASMWYGFPAEKLTLIGVTGTKGKTTTSHLIYFLLKESGYKVGLISTIGAHLDDREIDTGLHVTSPDSRELQKLLGQAVDKGLTHVVLEVTSSGLDQFRVWGIKFKVSVLTNIYPDHLDYHGTIEKYVAAKAKIIRQSETVVLSKDSKYFGELTKTAKETNAKVITIDGSDRDYPSFSVLQNELMAMAAVKALGVPEAKAAKALKDFKGVKGRLEIVYQNKFLVVIDFAHTPESLEIALGSLRKSVKKNGRLIAVFGCAGERDHGRRKMGGVAAKLADFFVITAEDPRTENVEEISEEIAGWAKKAGASEASETEFVERKFRKLQTFIRIPDRQEAINFAVKIAKTGDVVGLFGKGHEKSMAFGKTEMPWNEHEAVKKALKICAESLDI